MGTIRPGTPREHARGEYWREVCTCGWIGRWWRGHYNAVYRTAPLQTWKHRKERAEYYADEAATQKPERTKKMSDEKMGPGDFERQYGVGADPKKLRVRIEVREWAEFEVSPEWFAGEGGETPDELWKSVVEMYGEQPGLAWEATEGENWQVRIKRLGTDDFLHRSHLQPGELLPRRDDDE